MRITLSLFIFVSAIMITSIIRQNNYELRKSVYFKQSLSEGAKIYSNNCLTCHMADGGGVPGMNPPLIKTSFIQGNKEKLIGIVLKGMSRQEIDSETYSNVMPSFSFLKDKEIADVLTYVRKNFGNNTGAVSETEVRKIRGKISLEKK
jgi:mono/diheme cytochrome c family protein